MYNGDYKLPLKRDLSVSISITPLSIPEVLLIQPKVFRDDRGFFMETYQSLEYRKFGIPGNFVQDNHSGSRQGTLRGLHYQIFNAQGKLIRAISGEIFDVAVDLRVNSPTFGHWTSSILSAENKKITWIPPGFAHGFYVLSEWSEIVYKATDVYTPEAERTLLWNDPAVGIKWPLLKDMDVFLSKKDELGKPLSTAEVYQEINWAIKEQ
jgi:dTDP-4-dehydrorhamnose 3,5-epimerase